LAEHKGIPVEDVIQLSAREGYLVKLLDNEEYALASAPADWSVLPA
jgi:hypothetical protein